MHDPDTTDLPICDYRALVHQLCNRNTWNVRIEKNFTPNCELDISQQKGPYVQEMSMLCFWCLVHIGREKYLSGRVVGWLDGWVGWKYSQLSPIKAGVGAELGNNKFIEKPIPAYTSCRLDSLVALRNISLLLPNQPQAPSQLGAELALISIYPSTHPPNRTSMKELKFNSVQ